MSVSIESVDERLHNFMRKSIFLYGKNIFIIVAMGLFSGDGTGCTARLFRKYGADVIGGLHLKMPDRKKY